MISHFNVQDGLHPASELARFFPDLVRNGTPLFPPTQSPPSLGSSPSMYPASFGYINGQPVPLPTQPAPPTQPALPTPDLHADLRPASPYYSNMYLARQNSQPLHYPPVTGPSTPPPQPYHTSPSAYRAVPTIFQSPSVPSPVPHPTASPLPETKSKTKKDKYVFLFGRLCVFFVKIYLRNSLMY
jgi:hypothetical protein